MIKDMNPVILFVRDFGKSLVFYRDKLRLVCESSHGDFATFKVGSQTFHLHGGFGGSPGDQPLHVHFRTDDIRAEVSRLKAAGVGFTQDVESKPYGVLEASFSDPDGNSFDLIQPL